MSDRWKDVTLFGNVKNKLKIVNSFGNIVVHKTVDMERFQRNKVADGGICPFAALVNEIEILQTHCQGNIRFPIIELGTRTVPCPILIIKVFGKPGISDLRDVYSHFYEKSESGIVKFEERSRYLIFQELAYAVKFLHDKKIAHCDIKPENILINENWSTEDEYFVFDSDQVAKTAPIIKLIDFACAVTEKKGEEGVYTNQINTLPYSAPELLDPDSSTPVSAIACDIWNCGIILHLLLIGPICFHFDANGEVEFGWDHFCDRFPNLPHLFTEMKNNIESMYSNIKRNNVGGGYETILLKTLARTPEKRPDMSQILHLLNNN